MDHYFTFLIVLLAVLGAEGTSEMMCHHDGNNYNIGESVTFNCTTAVCEHTRWKIKGTGCPYLDKCLKNKEIVPVEQCVKLRCHINRKMTFYRLIAKAECLWEGECKQSRETWMIDCIKYQCKVKRGNAETVVLRKACEWESDKKCYKLGTVKKEGCIEYRCLEGKSGAIGFILQKTGCQKNGGCAAPGEMWADTKSCQQFTCEELKNDDGVVIGVRTDIKQGCAFGKKCYTVDEKITIDGCNEMLCTRDENGYNKLEVMTSGCGSPVKRGECMMMGESVTKTCNQYTCNVESSDSSIRSFITIHKGCPEVNNPSNCRDVGKQWLEYNRRKKTCERYTCSKRGRKIMKPYGICFYKDTCMLSGETKVINDEMCACARGSVECGGMM